MSQQAPEQNAPDQRLSYDVITVIQQQIQVLCAELANSLGLLYNDAEPNTITNGQLQHKTSAKLQSQVDEYSQKIVSQSQMLSDMIENDIPDLSVSGIRQQIEQLLKERARVDQQLQEQLKIASDKLSTYDNVYQSLIDGQLKAQQQPPNMSDVEEDV